MNWSEALVLDFTGSFKTDEKSNLFAFDRFDKRVMELIRSSNEKQQKLVVTFDTAFGWQRKTPSVVKDHINLSGYNPLIGPNHPGGERFPVVQDIYVFDCGDKVTASETVIVAGLKHGKSLNAEDSDFLHILGAECYCYNTVPTMIVAAHLKWKVLSLVGPDNHDWQKDCFNKIKELSACAK